MNNLLSLRAWFRLPESGHNATSPDQPTGRRNAEPAGREPVPAEPRSAPRRTKPTHLQTLLNQVIQKDQTGGGSRKLKKKRKENIGGLSRAASADAVSRTRPLLTESSFVKYKWQLNNWVENAPSGEREARQRAAARITSWCEQRMADGRRDILLGLPNFGLSTIPPLPEGEWVPVSGPLKPDASGTRSLPDGRLRIDLSGNPILESSERRNVPETVRDIDPLPRSPRPGRRDGRIMNTRVVRAPNPRSDAAPTTNRPAPVTQAAASGSGTARSAQVDLQAELLQWAHRANDEAATPLRLGFYQRVMNLQNQPAGDQAGTVPDAIASNFSAAPGTDSALQEALMRWVQSSDEADVGPRIEIFEGVMRLLQPSTVDSAGRVPHVATGNSSAAPATVGGPDVRQSQHSVSRQAPMPAAKKTVDSSDTTRSSLSPSASAKKEPSGPGSSRTSIVASSGSVPHPGTPAATSISKTSTAARLRQLYQHAGVSIKPSLKRPLPAPPLSAPALSAPLSSEQAVWDRWIGAPGQHRGQREEAVRRIKAWSLDPRNASNHEPLILSELDLDEIPPELPKSLTNLQFKNNRLNELPPLSSFPEGLLTLNLEGNPVSKLSPDSLDETRNRLVIAINGTLLPNDVTAMHSTETGPIYAFIRDSFDQQIERWVSLKEDESAARKLAADKIRTWLGQERSRGLPPLDLSANGALKFSSMPPIPMNVQELIIKNQDITQVDISTLPPDLKKLDITGNKLTDIQDDNLPESLRDLIVDLGNTTLAPHIVRRLTMQGRYPAYNVIESSEISSNNLKPKRYTYDESWSALIPAYQAYIDEGGEDKPARKTAIERLEQWVHGDNGEISSTPLDLKRLGLLELPKVWPHNVTITSIDAKGNNLREIPLSTLPPSLKFLDLRNNKIQEMPPELTKEQMQARAGKNYGGGATGPGELASELKKKNITLNDPRIIDPRERAGLVIILNNNQLPVGVDKKYESRAFGPGYIFNEAALRELEHDSKDQPEASLFHKN